MEKWTANFFISRLYVIKTIELALPSHMRFCSDDQLIDVSVDLKSLLIIILSKLPKAQLYALLSNEVLAEDIVDSISYKETTGSDQLWTYSLTTTRLSFSPEKPVYFGQPKLKIKEEKLIFEHVLEINFNSYVMSEFLIELFNKGTSIIPRSTTFVLEPKL